MCKLNKINDIVRRLVFLGALRIMTYSRNYSKCKELIKRVRRWPSVQKFT